MGIAIRMVLLTALLGLAACFMRPATPPGPFLVFFADSSVVLSTDARAVVENAAAAIRRDRPSSVWVNGYADSTGPSDLNFALSDQRAAAVERGLIAAGVDPGLIRKIAYGAIPPVAPGVGARRVEIRLDR